MKGFQGESDENRNKRLNDVFFFLGKAGGIMVGKFFSQVRNFQKGKYVYMCI